MQSREFPGVSQLNSKEIYRIITPAASSNSFSKDNEKSQPQPQKKGRSSIIDSGDENRTLMYERDCFRSHFRKLQNCLFVCLFCLNEFSSHDIICILNKMSKRFRFRSLSLEQYTKITIINESLCGEAPAARRVAKRTPISI